MKWYIMPGVVVFSAIIHIPSGFGQRLISMRPLKPVICYYSYENKPDHIPAPQKFKKWRENFSARTKSATFEVDYVNFPADNVAKKAFQYAVDIWESHLVSTVPIRIHAEWRSLEPGVLGQAIWGRSYANFPGAQYMDTFYPVALAEKISRKQLNDAGEADIVASFSSNTAWYYGTDGNTPTGKMDLVTIVLHEIAHGLGFTDTYDVQSGKGSVGLPNGTQEVPFVYDLFVENGSDQNLFQGFPSPSAELGTQLQNSNLFFDSPLTDAALSGQRAKLFAPSSFDGGSSISHLDEATFNAPGDPNRLMTPQIAFAESIHDPGSVLLAVLSDIGWIYTNIQHAPLKDTEVKSGNPFLITALIQSDNGYLTSEVKLHYSTDDVNFTVVKMNATGNPDEFQASLPGTTDELTYEYFISVVDDDNRTFTNPGKIQAQGNAPEQGMFVFHIGPDVIGPEIKHEPVENVSATSPDVEILAEVTDNLEVKEAVVEYFINEGALQTIPMQREGITDQYTATITIPPGLAIGSTIEYRILARDNALVENITMAPEEDYYTILVTGILPVQNSYVNDFNAPSNDFFGNSFTITEPTGFDDPAIHSTHPYPNGSGPNEDSNYTYQLQIPILIDAENPIIKFDEVVLVEPGADGSEFGDDDFFDYAVVEGSIDGGDTWIPFADGYDSRASSDWLTAYNKVVTDDNSVTQGDKSLFHERVIDMVGSGEFSAGEEVLIRFRLFADALAHGWGWAIDNLAIQEPVTDAEQPLNSLFNVYPVPATDHLVVAFLNPAKAAVTIQISDLQGRIIYLQEEKAGLAPLEKSIDLLMFKPGIYILTTKSQDKTYQRKFLKINP